MLRPKVEITIGNIKFGYVTNYSGSDSWEQLTEKYTIVMPNKLRFKGESIVNNKTSTGESLFKRKDPVTIKFGYFPNFQTIFEGFVSKIIPDSPLVIECQDAMYILKETSHTLSLKAPTLNELISEIVKDDDGNDLIGFETIDTTLGPFRISNANAVQVLDKLRGDPYGFFSFIQDGILKVGFAFNPGGGKEHNFDFERNIISHSLEYLREDDVKIAVKAVNLSKDQKKTERHIFFDSNGTITTSEAAPAGAEIRTLFFNNTSLEDMVAAAERKLPELIYEGWRGSFLTFGEPVVKHGDVAVLKSRRYPERDGKYLVKGVSPSGGVGGFRQKVELDAKVSA